VDVSKVAEAPVIDGIMVEDEWSSASLLADFHQSQPVEYTAPSAPTKVWLKYDARNLYIAARLDYPPGVPVTANILRQGDNARRLGDDGFGITIDPWNEGRRGYYFEVNPNGVRMQALYLNPGINFDWKGVWFVRTSQDESGWTAEIAIPFRTMAFNPEQTRWGIGFERSMRKANEEMAWTSTNGRVGPASSGEMVGINNIDTGLGLDLVPGITLQQGRQFTAGGRRTDSVEPSLDAFYRITPALTASVTLNTDFSVTEVDDRVVNLTRFSPFLPEKRAFFLEENDLFEFGYFGGSNSTTIPLSTRQNGRPFFSRRIGLTSAGQPVGLVGGGKMTGQIAGLKLGMLAVRQDAYANVDEADIFVSRITTNVLSQSSVGAIFAYGNPTGNTVNKTTGADFRYRNPRIAGIGAVEGDLWFLAGDTGTTHGNKNAWGIGLRSPNQVGWRAGLNYRDIGDAYNPALGFVNRRGIRDTMLDVGYKKRFGEGYLRSVDAAVELYHAAEQAYGRSQQIITYRPLELESRSGDFLRLRMESNFEAIRRDFGLFPGVTVQRGEYDFDQYQVLLETAKHRRASVDLLLGTGNFYDGTRRRIDAELTLRPSPKFNFGLRLEYNDLDLPGGNFISRLYRARADWIFSPRLAWTNLVQYDNSSRVVGSNTRMQWIPEPGREFTVQLNYRFNDDPVADKLISEARDTAVSVRYSLRY
jgi:hypothetical protein